MLPPDVADGYGEPPEHPGLVVEADPDGHGEGSSGRDHGADGSRGPPGRPNPLRVRIPAEPAAGSGRRSGAAGGGIAASISWRTRTTSRGEEAAVPAEGADGPQLAGLGPPGHRLRGHPEQGGDLSRRQEGFGAAGRPSTVMVLRSFLRVTAPGRQGRRVPNHSVGNSRDHWAFVQTMTFGPSGAVATGHRPAAGVGTLRRRWHTAPVTTVAVANQKGGVAKTTTVHTLGVALAELGQRVLLVDLDPQASLTLASGVDPDELEVSRARRAPEAVGGGRRPPGAGATGAARGGARAGDPARSTCSPPPSTSPAPSCTCSPRPAASTCSARRCRGARRLRRGADRLPAVARHPHHQRAHRRRRGAGPAPVRVAQPARRRASCSRPSTTCATTPTRTCRSAA